MKNLALEQGRSYTWKVWRSKLVKMECTEPQTGFGPHPVGRLARVFREAEQQVEHGPAMLQDVLSSGRRNIRKNVKKHQKLKKLKRRHTSADLRLQLPVQLGKVGSILFSPLLHHYIRTDAKSVSSTAPK